MILMSIMRTKVYTNLDASFVNGILKASWEKCILSRLTVTHPHPVIHNCSVLYLAYLHSIVKNKSTLMAPCLTFQPNNSFDSRPCACSLLGFCNTKSITPGSMAKTYFCISWACILDLHFLLVALQRFDCLPHCLREIDLQRDFGISLRCWSW